MKHIVPNAHDVLHMLQMAVIGSFRTADHGIRIAARDELGVKYRAREARFYSTSTMVRAALPRARSSGSSHSLGGDHSARPFHQGPSQSISSPQSNASHVNRSFGRHLAS